jgi:hypothetical protein
VERIGRRDTGLRKKIRLRFLTGMRLFKKKAKEERKEDKPKKQKGSHKMGNNISAMAA